MKKVKYIISIIVVMLIVGIPSMHVKAGYLYDDYNEYNEESDEDKEMYIDTDEYFYGEKSVSGTVYSDSYYTEELEGVTVYFDYNDYEYSAVTDSSGRFKIKNVPVMKHNKKIKIYGEKDGYYDGVSSFTVEIDPDEEYEWDIWHYYSYSDSTVQKGYIEHAHRGDTLKITIGKKVYKKKITSNKSKLKYKIKTKKFPMGTKIRFQLISKYGKKWVNYTDVIYGYKSFTVGDSKEHVKLTAGWRKPKKKTYTAYDETWWYSDGSFVMFDAYGRVYNWYVSN